MFFLWHFELVLYITISEGTTFDRKKQEDGSLIIIKQISIIIVTYTVCYGNTEGECQ